MTDLLAVLAIVGPPSLVLLACRRANRRPAAAPETV